MRVEELSRQFIKQMEPLDRSKHLQEKFRDFVHLVYCEIAKGMAPDAERADELEASYMSVVHTYKDKGAVRAYPALAKIVADGVNMDWDILGTIASEISILDDRMGQFFTPMELAELTTRLVWDDPGDIIRKEGFVTVYEPTCGSGNMVLAFAREMRRNGYNPVTDMLAWATDLSSLAYEMAYVQLSLAGIPAFVEQANSLTLERRRGAWTPAWLLHVQKHGPAGFASKTERTARIISPASLTQLSLF